MSETVTTKDAMLAPAHYGDEPSPIVAVEYHREPSGWKPCAVRTADRSYYDFDWCEQDQVLAYHCSGFGGELVYELAQFVAAPKLCAKLWHDPAYIRLVHNGQPVTHADARKLGYQIIPEPMNGNPFDDPDASEDEVEYCVQCEDHHPSESMCRHVQWSEDGGGWYLGCGASEVDFGEAQASLYRLLRMLPPATINKMLRKTLAGERCLDCASPGMRRLEDERNYEERYWPGIAWLVSLDNATRAANALTAGWIWQFQRQQWEACHVVPRHKFIRHLPMKKLDEWLALDPLAPFQLHDRPLRVGLGFKAQCANDLAFLREPERCHEVILWPPRDSGKCGYLGLTLSVAEVKRVTANAVDIYFGAVIERNGQHISEMEAYRLPIS